MDPRAHLAIADYLKQIHDFLWAFLTSGKTARLSNVAAVNNFMTGVLAEVYALAGDPCQTDEDCDQTFRCRDGRCTPIDPILDLVYAPLDAKLEPPQDDLKGALEAGYARIYEGIARALAKDPNNLSPVRDLLMRAYAKAHRIACAPLKKCDDPCSCAEGEVCVNGVCVPVPFQLKFRAKKTPTPPWSAEPARTVRKPRR